MTVQELDELCKRTTVSVVEAGAAFGLNRAASYIAAQRGELKTIRFGKRMYVPTKWLREQLEGV